MGSFRNWPPKVEWTDPEHVHPIVNNEVQPAEKKKKPKKQSKQRLKGGKR